MQLVMNAPFQAIYFATYESGKKAMGVHGEEEERLAVQVTHCASGQAWLPTSPRTGCRVPRQRVCKL